MNAASYSPPVDQLLTFGECEVSNAQWPDYLQQLGLQAEHIPDLIRLAGARNSITLIQITLNR